MDIKDLARRYNSASRKKFQIHDLEKIFGFYSREIKSPVEELLGVWENSVKHLTSPEEIELQKDKWRKKFGL